MFWKPKSIWIYLFGSDQTDPSKRTPLVELVEKYNVFMCCWLKKMKEKEKKKIDMEMMWEMSWMDYEGWTPTTLRLEGMERERREMNISLTLSSWNTILSVMEDVCGKRVRGVYPSLSLLVWLIVFF